jgi:hypothetical protein
MQAQAVEYSGYAGPFRCFFREEIKDSLFQLSLFHIRLLN